MRLIRNLALMLVGLFLATEGFAQTTPIMNQIPWFDYRPERIANDFQSIIGRSGTNTVSGSTNRGWTTYNNDMFIDMPFPFTFMRTNYPQGYRIIVQHQGWLSFSGYTTTSDRWTYNYYPRTYYWTNSQTNYRTWNRMIAPYWTDLQTAGVSSPQGGVYYRVDGPVGDRVMTVEWRVRGGNYPSGPTGNFQALLYEKTSTIEFHYGDNSIDRTIPAPGFIVGYGALVGLRNQGQRRIARELTPEDFSNDEENFLYMIHPDQVIRGMQPGEDTISFTRINTFNQWGSTPYTPVDDAFSETYGVPPYNYYTASPYFHYGFPTESGVEIAYRLRPILNDLACDSVWFTPNNAINAYSAGTGVVVNARFENRASAVKNNMPTRFDVYYGGAKVKVYTSEQQLVSPGGRLGTANVTFNVIPGSTNAGPGTNGKSRNGVYEVRIYPQDPLEEDFKNDTCKIPYFILGQHDVLAFQILSPFENLPPLFTKYPVGVGVPIEARFLNVGVNTENNVGVGYAIYRQGESTPLYTSNAVIPGQFPSASFRDVNLPTWSPAQPGVYTIRIWSDLTNDEDRGNDSIPVLGQHSFFAAYEIELAAVGTNIRPLINERRPVGRPVPISATFVNNGITDATNTPATVTITDPRGNQVYNQTVQVQEIISEGEFTQDFPDFVPPLTSGPGRYTITVVISNSQDPIAGNNTFSWSFNVLPQVRGDVLVGIGERFETIQEARDSLFYLGVSGDVNLILIEDEYTVAPLNNEPSTPAIDFRGEIIGAGENARITWMPHPSKTKVTIHLKSPSGIGMWFGQIDNDNPSGYMTFDGGPNRTLHFDLENTGPRDLYVPLFFGRGSSNYAVKNAEIAPFGGGDLHCTQTISIPRYDQAFNQFSYVEDLSQQISAGIMLRNTIPFDPTSGGNSLNADTLFNQNNVFEGNHIRGFGYGIVSVGVYLLNHA
ncbi:MAG: hypothetical protein R3F28_03315 [Candidatus Kapaibacterium sp.]